MNNFSSCSSSIFLNIVYLPIWLIIVILFFYHVIHYANKLIVSTISGQWSRLWTCNCSHKRSLECLGRCKFPTYLISNSAFNCWLFNPDSHLIGLLSRLPTGVTVSWCYCLRWYSGLPKYSFTLFFITYHCLEMTMIVVCAYILPIPPSNMNCTNFIFHPHS